MAEIHPLVLVNHNAERGVIVNVPVEERVMYSIEFVLVREGTPPMQVLDCEFPAIDDEHASNKANALLLMACVGTDYWFSDLKIFRDGNEIQNNGLCICSGERHRFCPSHGDYLGVFRG